MFVGVYRLENKNLRFFCFGISDNTDTHTPTARDNITANLLDVNAAK